MKARLVWKSDICPICGKPHSMHSFDDECLQIGMTIAKKELLSTQEGRNAWYRVEVEGVISHLKSYWESHKNTVRSQFKKNFVPSVLEFYEKNGFVSKKQLEIAKDIAFNINAYSNPGEYSFLRSFEVEVASKRGDLLAEYVEKNMKYDELVWDDNRKKVRYYKSQGWLL